MCCTWAACWWQRCWRQRTNRHVVKRLNPMKDSHRKRLTMKAGSVHTQRFFPFNIIQTPWSAAHKALKGIGVPCRCYNTCTRDRRTHLLEAHFHPHGDDDMMIDFLQVMTLTCVSLNNDKHPGRFCGLLSFSQYVPKPQGQVGESQMATMGGSGGSVICVAWISSKNTKLSPSINPQSRMVFNYLVYMHISKMFENYFVI